MQPAVARVLIPNSLKILVVSCVLKVSRYKFYIDIIHALFIKEGPLWCATQHNASKLFCNCGEATNLM